MTEEIWGVWGIRKRTGDGHWMTRRGELLGGTRQEMQERAQAWNISQYWTYEARLRVPAQTHASRPDAGWHDLVPVPVPVKKPEMPAVEKLARALHAEAALGTAEAPGPLRLIVLDARARTEAEALARIRHVCGVAWSRLKDAEREIYLSRAIGLLGFIAELEK